MFKEIVDDGRRTSHDGRRTLGDHKSSTLSTSCSGELKSDALRNLRLYRLQIRCRLIDEPGPDSGTVENIMGSEEAFHKFLLFPQCCQKASFEKVVKTQKYGVNPFPKDKVYTLPN